MFSHITNTAAGGRPPVPTFASSILAVFPRQVRRHLVNNKPHAMVVRWIQPQHPVENAPRVLESLQPPKTKPESLHAAKEGPIVDAAPGQHTIEVLAQR